MNLIALINSDMLYTKAQQEQVPYFKYSSWIESTVQKEVIAQLFKNKDSSKSQIPKDLITQDKTDNNKKKRSSVVQKNQMKNQLMQFLNKAKDVKMPKMPAFSGAKKSSKPATDEETKEESKSTTASS